MDGAALWHATAIGDKTLQDFDRPCVPVTQAAKAAATKTLNPTVMQWKESKDALDEDFVKQLESKNPQWPNANAENYRLGGLRTHCMTECGGVWTRISVDGDADDAL